MVLYRMKMAYAHHRRERAKVSQLTYGRRVAMEGRKAR